LGFCAFSFDLFGFSRHQGVDAVFEQSDEDGAVADTTDKSAEPDQARKDAADISFWGLGLFPVL